MRAIDVDGPADAGFVKLLRTMTISFASDAGFDIDQCDELRMAVNEACEVLLAAFPVGLVATFVEDGLVVQVTVRADEHVTVHVGAESSLVMTVLTDRWSIAQGGAISLAKLMPSLANRDLRADAVRRELVGARISSSQRSC
jgi:hypothetical protein